MPGEDVIVDAQEDFADRLRADAYFADLRVLTERTGDIQAGIDRALAHLTATGGKIGAAVIVQQAVANDDHPDSPMGPLDILQSFLVLENVLFNTGATGTGKHALAIARRIHRLMKHYEAGGLASGLVPLTPCIAPVAVKKLVAYEVNFGCTESDSTAYEFVDSPEIDSAGTAVPQTVTLTCGTADAAIYYTLDGTHPHAGNANATLYAAPFSVSSAALLRVGAHKSGCIASDVIAQRFTAA